MEPIMNSPKCVNCNKEIKDGVAPVISVLCQECRPLQIQETYHKGYSWIPERKLFRYIEK